jgi:hypothetical protein
MYFSVYFSYITVYQIHTNIFIILSYFIVNNQFLGIAQKYLRSTV